MTSDIARGLEKFTFPVQETQVYADIPGQYGLPHRSEGFKAIRRVDTGELIAVHRNTYRMVPNEAIIAPLLQEIDKLDTPVVLDPSHSFISNEKMRIQLSFPDLTIEDNESEICLSIFISNSYDGSTGFRLVYGGIRQICLNGLIAGEILKKMYRRHTSGFNLDNLNQEITETAKSLPVVQHRINVLQDSPVSAQDRHAVEASLGKKLSRYVAEQEEEQRLQNLWQLFNLCTYYVSHRIALKMRESYQFRISRLFKL